MGYGQTGLTVKELVFTTIERSKRWHNGDTAQWSVLEWAGAMCGEAGEAANAAKKLKRLEDQMKSFNEAVRHFATAPEAQQAVIKEVCDTILYAVLVAHAAGASPEEFVRVLCETFNRKSEEYDFPERIWPHDN